MKKKYTGIALAIALLSGACADFTTYRYRQWFAMVEPVESWGMVYRDKEAAFRFEITEKKIHVFFENLSDGEITLEWDKVVYIDPDGERHKTASSETLFTEGEATAKPSTVVAGKKEENVIVPSDYIEHLEKWAWAIKPLFNLEDDTALKNRGKVISIIFPVVTGEKEKTYRFDFMVTDVVPFRGRTPR